MPDWEALRAEFPALSNWTFLNSATFGQLPRRATDAMLGHFARRDATACADFLSWFDDHDRLRGKLARFIGCGADDIAFVQNAATGLAILLNGLDWRDGDELVTLAAEFPNNVYYPALLVERGVRFVEAPWPSMLDQITQRTRLVVVSTVNYATGFVAPLEEIGRRCREVGALFYVDGTQSLGALKFDWEAIQPDWFVVHTYKWMLTPNGVAFCASRPEVRDRIAPQVVGWRSHKSWRQVDHLHHGAPEFVSAAEKYEGGGLPTLQLYGMEAVVDMMLELGAATLEERVLWLAEEARVRLRALGATLPYDAAPDLFRCPIVCARFDGRDPSALAKALRAKGVLVSARLGHLRVSPHFYNNTCDLDRMADALRSVL